MEAIILFHNLANIQANEMPKASQTELVALFQDQMSQLKKEMATGSENDQLQTMATLYALLRKMVDNIQENQDAKRSTSSSYPPRRS